MENFKLNDIANRDEDIFDNKSYVIQLTANDLTKFKQNTFDVYKQLVKIATTIKCSTNKHSTITISNLPMILDIRHK